MKDAKIQAEVRRAFRQKLKPRASGEPRAISVTYGHAPWAPMPTGLAFGEDAGLLWVVLESGAVVAVPVRALRHLRDAPVDILAAVQLEPDGTGLRWDLLDVDYELTAVLDAAVGYPTVAARAMGRAGGTATSPAKRRASRANGAKGGRPRKAP